MTVSVQCGTCPGAVVPRRAGCAHGLCPNCWVRWKAAGFPEDGPPPPARPWGRHLAARLEDYSELRSRGLSAGLAAARMGTGVRQAERYEARLRAAAGVMARPEARGWDAVLRAAHARRRWLREHGEPVPEVVAILACQYLREWRLRRQGIPREAGRAA
jgi:hypothetical protein